MIVEWLSRRWLTPSLILLASLAQAEDVRLPVLSDDTYAPGPLVKGSDRTKFSHSSFARLNLPSGSGDVTLRYGPLSANSISQDDMVRTGSQLIEKLLEGGSLPTSCYEPGGGGGQACTRAAHADFFLVSLQPAIMIAVADEDAGTIGDARHGFSKSELRYVNETHAYYVNNQVGYWQCRGVAADPPSCRSKDRSFIRNRIFLSRVFRGGDHAWVIREGDTAPIPMERAFSHGKLQFEIVPVADHPDLLALRSR